MMTGQVNIDYSNNSIDEKNTETDSSNSGFILSNVSRNSNEDDAINNDESYNIDDDDLGIFLQNDEDKKKSLLSNESQSTQMDSVQLFCTQI